MSTARTWVDNTGALWHRFLHGFPLDRNLSIAGLIMTAAGTAIAVWQIRKVRRSAEAAKASAVSTIATLRSSTLSRLISQSVELARQLVQVQPTERGRIRLMLADWLTASDQIRALVEDAPGLQPLSRDRAIQALTFAQGAADDVLQSLDRLRLGTRNVDLHLLRQALGAYNTVMSGIVLLLENAEVARNE